MSISPPNGQAPLTQADVATGSGGLPQPLASPVSSYVTAVEHLLSSSPSSLRAAASQPVPGTRAALTHQERLQNITRRISGFSARPITAENLFAQARLLRVARFELAGLDSQGNTIQTDLRYLRPKNTPGFTKEQQARVLGATHAITQQADKLINAARCVKNQSPYLVAQIALACTPSHLLHDAALRKMGLPNLQSLIAQAEASPPVTAPSAPAQVPLQAPVDTASNQEITAEATDEAVNPPHPFFSNKMLIGGMGDELLVGKSRHLDSIPHLQAGYGNAPKTPSWGSRVRSVCGSLYSRLSGSLSRASNSGRSSENLEVSPSHPVDYPGSEAGSAEVQGVEPATLPIGSLTVANLQAHDAYWATQPRGKSPMSRS